MSDLQTSTEGEMEKKTDDIIEDVRDLRADKIDQADQYRLVKDKLDSLTADTNSLKERINDLQYRQMKYNLIFTGLHEPEEECEAKLRVFLAQEMNITHYRKCSLLWKN